MTFRRGVAPRFQQASEIEMSTRVFVDGQEGTTGLGETCMATDAFEHRRAEFLLQQTKGDVQFTKYIPRELPFAPTFLLLDIHRALATWIGPPLPAGERSAQVGDETIHERWQDGKLLERSFTSAKAQPPGTITVTYTGHGASNAASNIATHITLVNARLDYRVDIETVPFQ